MIAYCQMVKDIPVKLCKPTDKNTINPPKKKNKSGEEGKSNENDDDKNKTGEKGTTTGETEKTNENEKSGDQQ